MSNVPLPVGVVCADHIASLLSDYGITVLTHPDDFLSASKVIHESSDFPVPIIAMHPRAAGFIAWATATAQATRLVVVRSSDERELIPSVDVIEDTLTIGEALRRIDVVVPQDIADAPLERKRLAEWRAKQQQHAAAIADPWGEPVEPQASNSTPAQHVAPTKLPWDDDRPTLMPAPIPTAFSSAPVSTPAPPPAVAFPTPPPAIPAPPPFASEHSGGTSTAVVASQTAAVDVFTDAVPTRPSSTALSTLPARLTSPIILSMGCKGGVGKTTVALNLAELYARSHPDSRVILIDGSRGQADLRVHLGLDGGDGLPSIRNFAMGTEFDSAIISSERASEVRHAGGLPPVHFDVLLGPTKGHTDSAVVTAGVYRNAIDAARARADLVVVDTQIFEDFGLNDLFDGCYFPLLESGAFAAVVTDVSRPGISNTRAVLSMMSDRRIPKGRLLFLLNRMELMLQPDRVQNDFGRFATVVGGVPMSSAIYTSAAARRIDPFDADFYPVLVSVLNSAANAELPSEPPANGRSAPRDQKRPKAKRRWFGLRR